MGTKKINVKRRSRLSTDYQHSEISIFIQSPNLIDEKSLFGAIFSIKPTFQHKDTLLWQKNGKDQSEPLHASRDIRMYSILCDSLVSLRVSP